MNRPPDVLSHPLRVSENRHYLETSDGAPFFWLADTAWELIHRLGPDDIEVYLEDRHAKGYNVIQTVALAELGGLTEPNLQGELALIDGNPATPNPRYFEYVDWVVERAAAYGMRIALVPAWGAYITGGWGGETIIFDESNAFDYGRWLGQRYRDSGVAWLNGGDTNPLWRKPLAGDGPLTDSSAVFDALANGIIAGGGADQFVLYHPTALSLPGSPPALSNEFFGDREWLSANAMQSGHALHKRDHGWDSTRNYEQVATMWSASPTRPALDLENHYEDFWIDFDENNRMWDDADVRNGAYQAVFAGAAGHTYGNWNVWQMHDSHRALRRPVTNTWRVSLHSAGAAQLAHLKDLMLSRPYLNRLPAPELILGEAGGGEQHLAATRGADGSYLMVYLPFGQPVEVELSGLRGAARCGWWFSPVDGAVQDCLVSPVAKLQRFAPPSSGRGHDWVLVLDAQSFPPPGRRLAQVAPASVPGSE